MKSNLGLKLIFHVSPSEHGPAHLHSSCTCLRCVLTVELSDPPSLAVVALVLLTSPAICSLQSQPF